MAPPPRGASSSRCIAAQAQARRAARRCLGVCRVPPRGAQIGRISSASPQLGAAKSGQEAGIAPGRSPPTQPRPPPGPKGLPEGARREPANGTPGTESQKTRRSSKLPWPASNLVSQSSFIIKRGVRRGARALAGVSFIILPIALNVFHGSIVPFGTYSLDNGGPCQELVLFPPQPKRTLPMRKWNTPGCLARSAVVMNMPVDSAGAFYSSVHVPGYGEISN